jgi:tape measure domain-containing protein
MAAASIVIDLLLKSGSFETDTQRAGRALSKLSKDAKSSASAIANEFKRVQEAIQKAGMTANQQKLFELKGLGATQQQLVAYSRNLSELDRKTKQFATSNQTLATSFKGLAVGVGVGAAFSSITNLSDSYTKFSAQLKISTRNAQEFGQAYENVQRIATASQSDIESIGTVYARLSNATKDLGVTQSQVSDITETLSLSLKANGASSAEAASTLLQLSQAFGKGKLDGDEFRTAMEAAPNVMRALAVSMGVPFGALKDLGAQGEITAEVMIKAFTDPKLLEGLREQAKQLQTIKGGYVEITNELGLLVGETNNATGATSLYAKTLGGVAALIREIRKGGGFDAGLASLIPGGQAFSVFNQAGRRASNNNQSRSGTIGRASPVADSSQSFADLSKGLNLTSIKLQELVKTQEEAVRSLNSGKISYAQYSEIIAATGKEMQSLTDKNTKNTRSAKENSSAITDFARQQQEIANILQKARDLNAPELSRFDQLQQEIDAYTKLNPAVREYAENMILAAKAREQAEQFQELMVDQIDREIESYNEASDAEAEFEKSIQDYVDSLQRAADPTIELADNIGKLQSALNRGMIDQETFDNLSKFIEENDKSANEVTDFWRKAAENMQDAMSDFFFDIMQGNLSDLAGSFKATIDRMVANVLAAKAATKIFGDEFLTGKSDKIGGIAGDIFGGIGSFFGDLLPSFDVGTPYVQQDMVAKIHKGERIMTADENRAFSSGSMGGTVVMNIQTPNADSFRKSQPQIMAEMQRSLNRGRRVV